ncbi:hypothetical protein FRB96_006430 [Tulasnella sp. 330]|nr:hypothetical protein FRB96_006430 [Tulasnella sp. 330]
MHRLPIELLIKVFTYAVGIDGFNTPYDYPYKLYALAFVCRTWGEVIQSPELWRVADGNRPLWPVILARSKSYQLMVMATWNTSKVKSDIIDVLPRCRALRLRIELGHDISALENAAAPELETLELEGLFCWWKPRQHPLVANVFRDYAPKLKSLALDRFSLRNWGLTTLSGLRALKLCRLWQNCPSTTEILAILRQSPELQDFKLNDADLRSEDHHDHDRVLLLARLRKVELGEIPLREMERILDTIRAPSGEYLHFGPYTKQGQGQGQEKGEKLLRRAMSSFAGPAFQAALRTASRIDISDSINSETTISVTRAASSPDFVLTVPEGAAHLDLAWVSHFLDSWSAVVLPPISITFGHLMFTEGISFAGHNILNVDHLHFKGKYHTLGQSHPPDVFIQALSGPMTEQISNGSGSTWLFPGLQDLTYTDTIYDPELLLLLVRARTSASHHTAAGYPVRLRSLRLLLDCSMRGDIWREIKAILGEGAYWEEGRLEDECEIGEDNQY